MHTTWRQGSCLHLHKAAIYLWRLKWVLITKAQGRLARDLMTSRKSPLSLIEVVNKQKPFTILRTITFWPPFFAYLLETNERSSVFFPPVNPGQSPFFQITLELWLDRACLSLTEQCSGCYFSLPSFWFYIWHFIILYLWFPSAFLTGIMHLKMACLKKKSKSICNINTVSLISN